MLRFSHASNSWMKRVGSFNGYTYWMPISVDEARELYDDGYTVGESRYYNPN